MTAARTNARDRMIEMLHALPDDSSFDELLRELVFASIIERGLDDARAGRTISHEEMGEQIASWAR